MFKKTIKKILVRDGGQKLTLVNAYNEKCFWVHNGPVLSNLQDLLRALKIMTLVQYAHHVTDEKNDFVGWVSGVLADELCAKELLKADTPKKAAKAVEERLKDYQV